jgi:hypothetical protein
MSAWVAPSIAAEIWGISVDQVLAGIADGSIQSCVDGQFLFVDLSRNGLPKTTPRESIAEPIVTREEMAALTFEPIGQQSEIASQSEMLCSSQETLPENISPVEVSSENSSEELSPEEMLQVTESDFRDVTHWRTAREQTAQIRRPPNAQAA